MLEKHKVVLDLSDDQPFDKLVVFNLEEDMDLSEEFHLAEDDWGWMGRPTQVTITIEPGDQLSKVMKTVVIGDGDYPPLLNEGPRAEPVKDTPENWVSGRSW